MQYKKNFIECFPGIFNFTKPTEEKGRHINGNALVLYFYICHHYCLSERNCILLSYEEIRNGTMMDKGLKFSKDCVTKSLEILELLGLLKVKPLKIPPRNGQPPKIVNRYRPMCPIVGHMGEVYLIDFPCLNFGLAENNAKNFQAPSFILQEDAKKYSSSSSCSVSKEETKETQAIHKYPLLNNNTTITPSAKNQQLLVRDIATEFTSLLWDCVGEQRRKPDSKITDWKKLFDTYVKKVTLRGGDLTRVRKVLKWYSKNIGKEFVPEAFSVGTFTKKFSEIEGAMKRSKLNSSNTSNTWSFENAKVTHQDDKLTEQDKLEEEESQRRRTASRI